MISCVLRPRAICHRALVLIPRALNDDATPEGDDQARLTVEELEDFIAVYFHANDRLRAVAVEQQAAGKGGGETISPGCGLGDKDHAWSPSRDVRAGPWRIYRHPEVPYWHPE